MTEMTTKRDPEILAAEIRTLQQQAQGILLSYAIEIGKRLYEAKNALHHGEWGTWLAEKVQYSQSTANNYMKLYDRYGQEQVSLFGGGNSDALKNLPYTKALKLLALPEEEAEEFLEENDIEKMSTRELEQAIRERDAAKAEKSTMEAEKAELAEKLEAAQSEAKASAEKARQLQKELEELENRPVEVAVEPPSEEMLEEIRAAEAEKFRKEKEELQKKISDTEEKARRQADKVKTLKEAAAKAEEKAKAESKESIAAAEKAREEAEQAAKEQEKRAEELEKKLKLADSSAAVFQVYFTAAQEDINRMLGLIQKADAEKAEKFRSALRKLLETLGAMV